MHILRPGSMQDNKCKSVSSYEHGQEILDINTMLGMLCMLCTVPYLSIGVVYVLLRS